MPSYILSCDWGTTSFRLRLVETATGTIHHEITSSKGVGQLFHHWKDNQPEKDRTTYFQEFLQSQINFLKTQVSVQVDAIPIVISGMASSSIGMRELPYANLPFGLRGENVVSEKIAPTESFNHSITLISGLCSDSDVMRGEEVQMVGLDQSLKTEKAVCILPGTHSKHIYVENGQITDFRTYMTGELFQLMSQQSILRDSVSKVESEWNDGHFQAFKEGVIAGKNNPILQQLFTIRVAQLFQQRTNEENGLFLSGLLIGSELGRLSQNNETKTYLFSGGSTFLYYKSAQEILEINAIIIPAEETELLAVKGQLEVLKLLEL